MEFRITIKNLLQLFPHVLRVVELEHVVVVVEKEGKLEILEIILVVTHKHGLIARLVMDRNDALIAMGQDEFNVIITSAWLNFTKGDAESTDTLDGKRKDVRSKMAEVRWRMQFCPNDDAILPK